MDDTLLFNSLGPAILGNPRKTNKLLNTPGRILGDKRHGCVTRRRLKGSRPPIRRTKRISFALFNVPRHSYARYYYERAVHLVGGKKGKLGEERKIAEKLNIFSSFFLIFLYRIIRKSCDLSFREYFDSVDTIIWYDDNRIHFLITRNSRKSIYTFSQKKNCKNIRKRNHKELYKTIWKTRLYSSRRSSKQRGWIKKKERSGETRNGIEQKKKKERRRRRGRWRRWGCDRLHNCTVHSTNVSILSINPRYKSNLRFGRRGGEIPWGVDRADRGKDPREPRERRVAPGKEKGLRNERRG